MIRSNLSLTCIVIGLCSDPSTSSDELSQFIAAGADIFWHKIQNENTVFSREVLEKWLNRNVTLNTSEINIQQLIEDLMSSITV